MSGIRKVLENSFLYTFSSLLVKAIGFILLPVYTKFLTPDDYGITNLVNSFIGVASFIVAFSLYSAIIRFYVDYKSDREKLKRFYGSILMFISISGLSFAGIMFLFRKAFVRWLFDGIDFFPFVVIALSTLTFICLHTAHQSILKGMQSGRKLTAINLIVFVLQVGLNLFFIGVLKLGATGVLLSSLLINVIYVFYMLYDLVKNDLISFCIDIDLLKAALKYSVPIMPHNLSTSIASFASRVFLNKSTALASVGLYSVSMQFGAIIDMVQSSVYQAFTPWLYNLMGQEGEEKKKDIVVLSKFLLILYSLLYMGIGLFSPEVLMLMTAESYHMAWTVIPILVIAFSVKSIYYFYINILFYYKEAANKIFISTVTGSFADIILASILVKHYGMYGAALAFLVAKVIVVSLVVVMSKKYNDIGYRIIDMLKIIIPSLLFMGVGLYFSYTKFLTTFSWINLAYKIAIFLVYLIYIYLTNRKAINNLIKSGKIQAFFRKKGLLK